MSRPALLLFACGLVLLSPLGEGGRAPLALFVLHTLVILFAAVAWAGPGRARPPMGRTSWDSGTVAIVAGTASLALASISALRASYPLAAALGMWDLLVPFILFASAARAGRDALDPGRVRLLVVLSTTAQAVMAVSRYFFPGAAAGISFENRNHLAAFLNLGLLLALAQSCAASSRPRARAVWGGLALFHLLVLFMQESRGAIAAMFVSLFVLGARQFRAWSWRARTAAIGVVLACGLLAGMALGSRFSRSFDPYRFSRLSIWTATTKMMAERPLLGFGPGLYPHIAPRFNFPVDTGPVRYGRIFQGAHSAFLTLAAESGMPSALILVAALVGLTASFLRVRPRQEALEFGIGLALLALLVQGVVEDLQARPALTLVPALLAGTMVAARRNRRQEAGGVTGWLTWGAPARLVGAVLVVYLFAVAVLLPYWADRESRQALRMGPKGLRHMERAAILNPLHPDYSNDLAMAILNSGPLTSSGYARATDDLLEARRLKPIDYRFPLHLARLESRFAPRLFDDPGGSERAVDLYREAVRLSPLDPRPRLELGGILAGMRRHTEALAVLQEALALEPSFLRCRILTASILLDMGRRDEAREALGLAETTRAGLAGYQPDSDYAREIVLDAQAERERLATLLRAGNGSSERS